jgi:hypothetical protein
MAFIAQIFTKVINAEPHHMAIFFYGISSRSAEENGNYG